ncbi:lipolytic protein G-D-S-L family [Oscillatoria nigro-viridis PCC 7112]|uniref:Lipolytic protein G-D-S-L family n=1 Tax=Phormidium nigroviride PCC 7112 TaxID=179408 RepID=K9VNK0_9CYAN|nr:GDSL-type esterase/lipase family protein [Oscillatoria nigro-viridis]AFZ09124.1 lipolytic protein G-D-S-L family [Oscillatoria nigro-viridis PCC 7112]
MRICFIGDSFVNGTCDPKCLGWTGRICAAACGQGHDITYYNLGIRGETSADIETRWFNEVSCRLPHYGDGRIVFSFGVNDTYLENEKIRIEVEKSIENARYILTSAKEIFPVLMVGPPPVIDADRTRRIANLSEQFARVCSELNVPYLDVCTPLQTSEIWQKELTENDGSHPGAAGYAELAKIVHNWDGWKAWFKNINISDKETVTLFRAVGKKEMELIKESDFMEFPPRLSFQPTFYPVLQKAYAIQIARDWNTKDAASGYFGYVSCFRVAAEFLKKYPVQTVGSSSHQEYWIPAEELAQFNQNIVGKIEIFAEYQP